ncbi:Lrp/AsnC ligand binding domain-containing protein [Ferrovibrio xuzhouensis]|uniref:Lrp/AsnC ligand binding domain-containing protein n=1 Tax=Ferrovibrio xuzhouensis TaxID=1576914 RepID=A0ABV7VAJ3_9PROT
MEIPNIDESDRRILAALQDDGRISNAALAKLVGLSPAACFERVRRLRQQGLIRGFTALLDPQKLDRGLLVFVEIVLDRTTPDVFDQFARAVREMPEVLECHMVAGGFDYLIKVRVRDMEAYRQFLGASLTSLPGVRETHTYAVMEEVKHSMRLPL